VAFTTKRNWFQFCFYNTLTSQTDRQDRQDNGMIGEPFYKQSPKNSWTDRDAVWAMDLGGPKEACVRWGAHCCHLANTSEQSMCGGDAALMSHYFDHLLNFMALPYFERLKLGTSVWYTDWSWWMEYVQCRIAFWQVSDNILTMVHDRDLCSHKWRRRVRFTMPCRKTAMYISLTVSHFEPEIKMENQK